MGELVRPDGRSFSHASERITESGLVVPTYETLVIPEKEVFPFKKVVIASNRSPMKAVVETDGTTKRVKTIGGLATAVLGLGESAQDFSDMLWVASSGDDIEKGGLEIAYSVPTSGNGVEIVEFPLTARQKREYYNTISNECFWFVFHGLVDEYAEGVRRNGGFDMEAWEKYQEVNKKFATTIMEQSNNNPQDFIWIHDYHLMRTAYEMREQGSTQTIGFFLHIPFPPQETFSVLPQVIQEQVLEGLLAHDLVGFQTPKDRDNFLTTVKKVFSDKDIQIESSVQGEVINIDGRKVVAQAFPISIDAKGLEEEAKTDFVQTQAKKFKEEWGEGKAAWLHLSRLDPSKGILPTLKTHQHALREYEELRRDMVLILTVDPGNRSEIPAYARLYRAQVALIKQINAEFPNAVIHYEGMERESAIAALTIAEGLAANSEADGMNMTTKEYAKIGPPRGWMIIGEGVGAAYELAPFARVVNPANIEENAGVLYEAHTEPLAEKLRKKQGMRSQVEEYDVGYWGSRVFRTAGRIALAKAG